MRRSYLQKKRLALGSTMKAMAQAASVSQAYICLLENGKKLRNLTNIKDTLAILADVYDVEEDVLAINFGFLPSFLKRDGLKDPEHLYETLRMLKKKKKKNE